jgi:hypothetical protein
MDVCCGIVKKPTADMAEWLGVMGFLAHFQVSW